MVILKKAGRETLYYETAMRNPGLQISGAGLVQHLIPLFIVICGLTTLSSATSKELDNAVQIIAEQLTQGIKTENESIAIPPYLTLDNKTTMLGKLLSEKLINEFSRTQSPSPLRGEGRVRDDGG